jgi:hypothetical protein
MVGELFKADGQTDRRKGGRTDWQTDVTKLIVGFRTFANAPENDKFFLLLNSCKLVKQKVNEDTALSNLWAGLLITFRGYF